MNIASCGWSLIKDTFENFIADEALSRGASIAYYTLFAIAPVLLIVVAIAGLVFGREAAEGAIVAQLGGLMGRQTAEALQAMVRSASNIGSGVLATAVGVVAVMLAITGVFGEVQSSLNAVWKAQSKRSTLSRLVRARMASLGLVVTSGFLLTVSLAVSAGLGALSAYFKVFFPATEMVLQIVDFLISSVLITGMFAAMYKVLPDVPIAWRDVAIGAIVTTALFEGGKYVIALYIGQSNIASSYGAAGALIVLLLWIYYSAQIFLLGAEFTHAFAKRFGSHAPDEENASGPSSRDASIATVS